MFNEVQFFELSSETNNILNACSFEYYGIDRLILSSRNQLLSLGSESGKFSLQELAMEGLPEDAEITTLTAFVAGRVGDERGSFPIIVVGFSTSGPLDANSPDSTNSDETGRFSFDHSKITQQKGSNTQKNQICIYACGSLSYLDAMDLSSVTQVTPQKIELDFVPLEIQHLPETNDISSIASFLVTGNDASVHMFGQKNVSDVVEFTVTKYANGPSSQASQDSHEFEDDGVILEGDEDDDDDDDDEEDDDGDDDDDDEEEDENSDSEVEHVSEFSSEASGDKDAPNDNVPEGLLPVSRTLAALTTEPRTPSPFYFHVLDVPTSRFHQIHSPILTTRSRICGNGSTQMFCVGCENGMVYVFDGDSDDDVNMKSLEFDGPITCVDFVNTVEHGCDVCDIVVGSALGFAAIIPDVPCGSCTGPLNDPIILPQSDAFDSVLCCAAADVDWDGHEEVLIGTFGRQLLAYRKTKQGDTYSYQLSWAREFAYPIYSIKTGDYNQDGAAELVVNTQRGVHILQPDLNQAADTILKSLQELG